MPERAFLGMIGARGITWGWPNAAIFFVNKIVVVQFFRTTVAPFITYTFVQAFGESFSEAISESLRHDRVVVVVLGPVRLAQLLQSDATSDCECADMIEQPRSLWRDEIGERTACLASFFIGLLPEKMKFFDYFFALVVSI